VSDVHRLVCGCSYIRVPGQYVGIAGPTVDVLSVCHDHGPKRSECPDVSLEARADSRAPGSRRPGDVAPALILDGGRSADKRCVSTPNAARAGGRNATPAQHPGGEIGASGPSIPPRGAIPANPTPQLPPAETGACPPSSEGAGPSAEVSA